MSHATLRFLSWAEQRHTQNHYLRCFKPDFDAVKSKFGLLIEYIKKTTPKWRWPQKWIQPKKRDDLKNEDDLKKKDDFKTEDNLKN